jgi:Carbohydrate-binding module 48 (Isoamylase N-terminal domain)
VPGSTGRAYAYPLLGAHVREIDGTVGSSFAVWAPTPQAVSVVGDVNSRDGRLHAMRMLGSSGIWEIFIPDVVQGAAYKYEILTEGDHLRLTGGPSCLPRGPGRWLLRGDDQPEPETEQDLGCEKDAREHEEDAHERR